eukprot:TRINITY_DN93630_c0_g1_i1.p1 TRINITY_DN93630_c0_g1~~TRINITY_DN93630_c0_g1_i1.p1  ORF type:complete len:257 (+),score=9.45 TRINITY_DN93630_c0_g1_i1:37-807(+)
MPQKPDDFVVTFGTYNVLLPHYAVKWNTPEGIDQYGDCTWEQRCPALRDIITGSWLDMFLFQETASKEMADLHQGDTKKYRCIMAEHTGRSDALAIWYKPWRFQLLFETKIHHTNGHVSLFAKFRHANSGTNFLVGSVHVDYDQTAGAQQLQDIQQFVDKETNPTDFVVIGGDFNRGSSRIPLGDSGFKQATLTDRAPNDKQIDHVWYREAGTGIQEITHRWSDKASQLSANLCAETSRPPSDHNLVVAALQLPVP